MGTAIILLAAGIAVIVLALRGSRKKSDGKQYLAVEGKCPTCGGSCKWYTDPETGRRFFRCGWCGDFSG